MTVTVSFLASGRGSNFTAVASRIRSGEIKAQLGVLVTDKADAGALIKARELDIASKVILPGDYTSREDHERDIIKTMKSVNTDLIVTAGYMRILTPYIINKFRNRIINIHPALLPSFPGVHGQKQAFDYGVKLTGCTVHFIDEGTDTGPIILQSAVPVQDNDTVSSLSARILEQEHVLLPRAVELFCQGRLKVMGRKVIIK